MEWFWDKLVSLAIYSLAASHCVYSHFFKRPQAIVNRAKPNVLLHLPLGTQRWTSIESTFIHCWYNVVCLLDSYYRNSLMLTNDKHKQQALLLRSAPECYWKPLFKYHEGILYWLSLGSFRLVGGFGLTGRLDNILSMLSRLPERGRKEREITGEKKYPNNPPRTCKRNRVLPYHYSN